MIIIWQVDSNTACLAKHSLSQDIGLCSLPAVPDFAVNAMLDDLSGLVRPRSVQAALAAE